MMKKIILAVIFSGIIYLAGCASVETAAKRELSFTAIGSAVYPAKPQDYPVDLFFNELPEKEYDVIGEVSGSIAGDPKELLKARARQAGGDGMIISELASKTETSPANLGIEQRSRPADIITPVYTPGYSYKVYTVKGKVIKYK